ncbi:MAG: type II toxin-antitoxin system VapC family toxin [Acidobacteria bacterium]|nr:type II toxin-antitoxin system VapC family toxin [Acidobacteriota bacterium]
MPATVLVPDASVLLKWILRSDDEPDRDRASDLKTAWLDDACELIVPSLWVFEVGNILGLKHPATAAPLLQAMLDLGLREEAPHGYAGAILSLMREHKVTFYDAAYHALAIRHRGTMLTADRAYVKKAARAGHVTLLNEWRAPAAR